MRYSSAAQIRHKPIPIAYGEVMPVYNRGAYRPEQIERREFQSAVPDLQINPSHQNLQLDVPRNYLDSTSLLKEISKKYILIPKLRSTLVNDNVGTIPPQPLPPIAVSSPQPNITSNEDWKSKYDILEQLKEKEKQEPDKYVNELYPVKEKQLLAEKETKRIDNFLPKKDIDGYKAHESGNGYGLQSYNKEFSTKYEDVAEKDLPFDKASVDVKPQNVEKPKISDSKDQEPTTDHAPTCSASAYTNSKTVTTYDDYKLHDQILNNYAPVEDVLAANNIEKHVYDTNCPTENVVASEYSNEEVTNNTEHDINDVAHQDEYPIEHEQSIEIEQTLPDSKNVYLDPDDYSPIQVLTPSDAVEQINNVPTVNDSNEVNEKEVVEYPVEMLNVEEFTPKDNVKLIDGENVNPKYFTSEDNIEPLYENEPQTETVYEHTIDPQDSSGIEAFDTEQREMFYSEETPQYAYDQQQENVYNENYAETPAQDYAYYESPAALQEQEHPVEINEHEESNERYDQNYEQQFTTEYEQQEYQGQEQQYNQPEGYDPTEQQIYAEPEGYNQTEQQQYSDYNQTEQQRQDYEYQQPDQDTVQNIQHALDDEAGYVDNTSENTKVVSEANPVAQKAGQDTA